MSKLSEYPIQTYLELTFPQGTEAEPAEEEALQGDSNAWIFWKTENSPKLH